MEAALADMQARLQVQEASMAGAAALEQRLRAAETGLAQASAVIGQQRQQIEDMALRTAASRQVQGTPQPEETKQQSFIDTRAVGKPTAFSGEVGRRGWQGRRSSMESMGLLVPSLRWRL